jgi:hypothetical protein
MDEVLTHALILGEGEKLFKASDISLEISAKDQEKRPSLI